MALDRRARGAVGAEVLPRQVGRTPEREADHARSDRAVGDPVDQDEVAGVAVVRIGIEGGRPVEAEVREADLVHVELLGRPPGTGVHVEPVLQFRHRCRVGRRSQSHDVGPARQHRRLVQPYEIGGELVGKMGRLLASGQEIAAGDVDGIRQGERHRLSSPCLLEIAVEGDDAGDPGLDARGLDGDLVTDAKVAAEDRARVAAKTRRAAIDPLHTETEGLARSIGNLDRFEIAQQRRPLIPGRRIALPDDVVALQC